MSQTRPCRNPPTRLDAGVGNGSTPTRVPKAAEIVARTLRRMVVEGELKEGDFLPNEAELMHHFAVGRSTLREALRLLESDGLVEVRRGSRSGARVRMPGPEIVARPIGLLLQVAKATIADVMTARSEIEVVAARLLAKRGSRQVLDELESFVRTDIPAAFESGHFAQSSAMFHRRLVESTGNATLSVIAGMLHEVTECHTAEVLRRRRNIPKAHYEQLQCSHRRFIDLLRAGDEDQAEAHWRRHTDTVREVLLYGFTTVRVRDIID